MKTSQSGWLRLIAVFKLLKASALIVVGAGILRLMHNNVAAILDHWVVMLGLDPGNRYIDHALQKAASLPHHKFKEFGVGSFIYAGLFATEGIGLWLLKRWAEWFTVVITSSLIPLEIYEIYRHPTIVKILILIVNIAVVGYLVYRIRTEKGEEKNQP